MAYYEWRPYVSAAERRALGRQAMARRRKKGLSVEPVEVKGRTIARSFWGRAWCDHLEKFSDFANRLPRGRTYVRNGSVCHLEIASGMVRAMVMGSDLYEVRVTVKKLGKSRWRAVKTQCAGGIATLLELLEGRLSEGVMAVVTDRDRGIFPLPREIALECSCPDWAVMCKHVAAVLYGVGARLDERPELLFLLRGVDHEELISTEPSAAAVVGNKRGGRRRIAQGDLAAVFDIDLMERDGPADSATAKTVRAKPRLRSGKRSKAAARGAKQSRSKVASHRSERAAGAPKRAKGTTTSARKTEPRVARRSTSISAPSRFFTGAAVARLRAKLGMTRGQLALLLGVNGATISNWEKTKGRLNLHARSHDALAGASTLPKADAWARLDVG
jgi:uncharacterized Zn finger protein